MNTIVVHRPVEGLGGVGGARPPHSDVHGIQDLVELAEMVGVRVGDRHHTQLLDTRLLEVADASLPVAPPGVDEHGGVRFWGVDASRLGEPAEPVRTGP